MFCPFVNSAAIVAGGRRAGLRGFHWLRKGGPTTGFRRHQLTAPRDRHVDPFMTRRLDSELYVFWLQEAPVQAGDARPSRRRCRWSRRLAQAPTNAGTSSCELVELNEGPLRPDQLCDGCRQVAAERAAARRRGVRASMIGGRQAPDAKASRRIMSARRPTVIVRQGETRRTGRQDDDASEDHHR
jgi:hypothetical protein